MTADERLLDPDAARHVAELQRLQHEPGPLLDVAEARRGEVPRRWFCS